MENLIKLVFGVVVLAAIPWAVAAIKKTPMTRKGYRILSIIFAVFPCGQTYEGLGATGNLQWQRSSLPRLASGCTS